MKTILLVAAFSLAAAVAANAQDATRATVKLEPKSGSKVTGTIMFTKSGDDVEVSGDVENLTPGKHGFHIHEKGDCSAPDAASAGGHFNPSAKPHGDPASTEHHGGDMPIVTADASGNATLEATIDTVTIGGANDIVGRAVVVHKDPD